MRVPVLVTLGVCADGRRVVLDLRLAGAESGCWHLPAAPPGLSSGGLRQDHNRDSLRREPIRAGLDIRSRALREACEQTPWASGEPYFATRGSLSETHIA